MGATDRDTVTLAIILARDFEYVNTKNGRATKMARGLKCRYFHFGNSFAMSHLVRGAWIEMYEDCSKLSRHVVPSKWRAGI